MELPAPGEILIYDFRQTSSQTPNSDGGSIRAVQWNVERNYQAEDIVTTLKLLNADIIFLQEIDIGCRRSGTLNHFREIAESLEMLGGFVCEFEEIESNRRDKKTQGGGIHGNAILTRFQANFRALPHLNAALDWEAHGTRLGEPRKGRRCTMVAEIQVSETIKPILCYSVHLEVYTGIVGRINEFSAIFADSLAQKANHPHQLVFGDLNTMGHSLARLSPSYCRDRFRLGSIPLTEAEFWHHYVFGYHQSFGPFNTLLSSKLFSKKILMDIRNPGFWDPWHCTKDVTLKRYWGLYQGKLDWTLVKGFDVKQKWMGNQDYSASDHVWMVVELSLEQPMGEGEEVQRWKERRQLAFPESAVEDWTFRLKVVSVVMAVGVVTYSLLRRL